MWNRTQSDQGASPQQLDVSLETKQKIQEAFSVKLNEESVKAFNTPVDAESLAKVIC